MLDRFKDWAKHPFQQDMDVFHWFMFMGMLILIMALWRFVLAHMKGAIT